MLTSPVSLSGNKQDFIFQIEDMSQAVGLRVLDVIFLFFLSKLRVTSLSAHVEKHTCNIMGVMGPFRAIPKYFFLLIRHHRRRKDL